MRIKASMSPQYIVWRIMQKEADPRVEICLLVERICCVALSSKSVRCTLMDYFITLKVWLLPLRVVTLTRMVWCVAPTTGIATCASPPAFWLKSVRPSSV